VGGYVALEGEENDSDDERSFGNKPAWAKILVLAAGPFMNFLFAVIILAVMIMVIGDNVNIFQAFVLGFKNCISMEITIFDAFKDLLTGAGSVNDVVGPVGIVNVVDETAQAGILNLIFLAVILSLNLGLFNILPFPALDGGRILFVIIRAITGKAISDELENRIHYAGLMILFGLMILITFKDVYSYIFV
jgi:RIP metalloprotease RseP